MAYRDELEAAHRRIADLEEQTRALAAELEAARRAPPQEAKPAPTTWRLATTAIVTFLGYVLVLGLFDGEPGGREKEDVAAWIGALLPVLASARFWWPRGRDRAWLAFNAARLLLVGAIASGAFDAFSRFGHAFVFFWWAPIASAALLLAEAVASRLR